MTASLRSSSLLVLFVAAGCASSTSGKPSRTAAREPAAVAAPRQGASKADPLLRCHLTRTDYKEIADTTCGDGANPLKGDLKAAHDAREGNVGTGSDGHFIDVYVVPCKPEPLRVFVDAYHCPAGMDPEFHFDAKHPTPEQLRNMGTILARLAHMPADDRNNALRKQSIEMLQGLPVSIKVCGNFLMPAVKAKNYEPAALLVAQLVISTGSAILTRTGGPSDAVGTELDAALGILTFYEVLLSTRGESARHPHLDLLIKEREAGTLRSRILRDHCQQTGT